MREIGSYSDLQNYLNSNLPINICWYGPRSADASEVNKLLNINGIISCYGGNEFDYKIPILTNDVNGKRRKCSVDNLVEILDANKKLTNFVKKNNVTTIVPYDTTLELEEFCKNNNIACFSSSDRLKDELRDKTKIDSISKEIKLPAIQGISGFIDDFEYSPLVEKLGLPLFLHFAEGAGGSGNYIVNTESEFEQVKNKQRGKKLNVKKYFKGRSCSIDICVTHTAVICGALEEMLIGAEPINSNPTEYVGSSWFENDYSHELRKKICAIGIALGELLRKKGFIGFFHPDFLVDNNDVFLTELNMRFGGSCGVYTKIQMVNKQVPLTLMHILTFQDSEIQFDAEKINKQNLHPIDYALIVLKNNFGKPITISHKYKSGLYEYKGNRIKLTDSGAQFNDLNDTTHILITGLPESGVDTTIEDGAFICQIVTRFPISNMASKLNSEGKNLAKGIFSQIII